MLLSNRDSYSHPINTSSVMASRSMLLTAYLELLIADLVGDQLSAAWPGLSCTGSPLPKPKSSAHSFVLPRGTAGDYSGMSLLARVSAKPEVQRGLRHSCLAAKGSTGIC